MQNLFTHVLLLYTSIFYALQSFAHKKIVYTSGNCPHNKIAIETPIRQAIVYSKEQILDQQECKIFDSFDGHPAHLNNRLSAAWTQELIGSDLAKEFISNNYPDLPNQLFATLEDIKLQSIAKVPKTTDIENCLKKPDSIRCQKYSKQHIKKAMHGNKVVNLVADPDVGSSEKAMLAYALTDFSSMPKISEILTPLEQNQNRYKFRWQKLLDSGAKFLCHSQIDSVLKTNQIFESNDGSGIIRFQAAGNDYPYPTFEARTDNSILIGALSATGTLSHYSSDGESVDLLVPVDHFVLSKDNGNTVEFSGTSSAQPLACGTGIDIAAFLTNISANDLRIVLKSSSVPIQIRAARDQLTHRHQLNSYRAIRVAAKLSNIWPIENIHKEIERILGELKHESKSLFLEAQKIDKLDNSTCQQKRKFNLLRQAYLLDPIEKKYRDTLGNFYQQHGFTMNAQYLENLNGLSFKKAMQLSEDKNLRVRLAALRELSHHGKRARGAFDRAFKSLEPREVRDAAIGYIEMGEKKTAEDKLLSRYREFHQEKHDNIEIIKFLISISTDYFGFSEDRFLKVCQEEQATAKSPYDCFSWDLIRKFATE